MWVRGISHPQGRIWRGRGRKCAAIGQTRAGESESAAETGALSTKHTLLTCLLPLGVRRGGVLNDKPARVSIVGRVVCSTGIEEGRSFVTEFLTLPFQRNLLSGGNWFLGCLMESRICYVLVVGGVGERGRLEGEWQVWVESVDLLPPLSQLLAGVGGVGSE